MIQQEKALQKEIVEYLNARGHAVWLNEVPRGMPSKKSPTGFRRVANRSTADIVGTIKGGRAIYIEVKLPCHKKKVQAIYEALRLSGYCNAYKFTEDTMRIIAQANFLIWQEKAGAIAIFAYCLDDVLKAING